MSHIHDDPEALAPFRNDCQEHIVFYGFICDAMPSFRNFVHDLMSRHSLPMTDPYRVGVGTPTSGLYPASLSMGDVLEKSDSHGEFANRLAKLTIVAIYALWEDHYRGKIAEQLSSPTAGHDMTKNDIRSDIMGDLRHIRICIIHRKSVISDEPAHFKVLDPRHYSSGPLQLTRAMMADIMDHINRMQVTIAGREPA